MRLLDSYILARTKRKTRRIRTALVVIISSLLFAVLFFGAFIGQGILDAGQQVKNVGFNGRNMVFVSPTGSGGYDYKAEYDKVQADMDAELKARGVKVTKDTRLDPSYQAESGRRMTKISTARTAVENQQLEANIQEMGNPTALYHFTSSELGMTALRQATPADDDLAVQITKQEQTGGLQDSKGDNPYGGFQFYVAEADMFRTQLQPGQSAAWQPGQPYPLFISYAYLEKISGQSFAKVEASERNLGYRNLMKTYAGQELTYCYRNAEAQDQLRQVVHYNYVAVNDKDAATKPTDVPICAGFDQKLLKKMKIVVDATAPEVKPLFPPQAVVPPDTRKLHFKIVGFVPSQSQFGGNDVVTQILAGVNSLPANPEMGVIPAEVAATESFLDPAKSEFGSFSSFFVDFTTRDEQKAFMDKGCKGGECGGGANAKPYMQSFGSVSLALEGIFRSVTKFLLIGAAIVMIIAAIMILFTMSKVIADSTKEIAVFRSLGARRRDIAQIYYTYGMMLAVAALVLAVILAVIGAKVATSMYAERVATSFVHATGAYNIDMHVDLLGIRPLWIGGILAALVVAAFIGISIPILASLRRKLINILREE